MIGIKFYCDSKPDKRLGYPIYLQIRTRETGIKVFIGEKIKKKDWDKRKQKVRTSFYYHTSLNKYIEFLKSETEKFIESCPSSKLSEKNIKQKICSLVKGHKKKNAVKIFKENIEYLSKKRLTFIDLFAGAGGFSEGFLQAEQGNKIFEFLLASDINENCELTHKVRYNYQLGLDAEFITQDITEPTFLDNLIGKIGDKAVDVVCGGPPCQSFSLAGKRKKFDKKDDLFAHYLKVIRQLRPKYFVMENVKGILTKEGGRIKEMILQEIRSIVDFKEFPQLITFVSKLREKLRKRSSIIDFFLLRLQFETKTGSKLNEFKEQYIGLLESRFKSLTPKIVDYKTSKTDSNILTIRHGLNLLKRDKELEYIRKKIIHEKAHSDLDGDNLVYEFDSFLDTITPEAIIDKIRTSFKEIDTPKGFDQEIREIIKALVIYISSFDDCVNQIEEIAEEAQLVPDLNKILDKIRLYRIDRPFVALSSNYGVPQNRERVLFIGCRKDQKLIQQVPSSVGENEKVTVFEALHDLDFVGNDQDVSDYEEINIENQYNGASGKMKDLLRKRDVDGSLLVFNGRTYAEWSRIGRLNGRFDLKPPIYVRSGDELKEIQFCQSKPLHNHRTSKQNGEVIKRLKIILKNGNYFDAKKNLKELGLGSDKRSYNVLKAGGQSPTVMTMPDDYIHYSSPRALTVREMARLQSFDDSFVFQGKRSTGGNKRKSEVPQYTLVGNAIPPLMARAIGMEILKSIN